MAKHRKVKFTDDSEKFLNDFNRSIIKGSLLGAELLATNIKKVTPVVTGNLRRSIEPLGSVDIDKVGLTTEYTTLATTDVEYAPPVEFGRNFAPRAMFRMGGDDSRIPVSILLLRNLPK